MAIKVIKNRKSFYAQAKIEIRILEFLNGKNCDGDKGVGKFRGIGMYLCV